MSIRTRIAVSIFFSALVLVLIFAGLRYQEVIHNSEERSEEQAVAKAKSLQTELRFLLRELKKESKSILGPRLSLPTAVTGSNPAKRYRWTLERSGSSRIDILKVLDANGGIVSSRHWPTSFGVLDANSENYSMSEQGHGFFLEQVRDGEGAELSMQMWRRVKAGERFYTLVVGSFLGSDELKRILKTQGADILVMCVRGYSPCWHSAKSIALNNRLTYEENRPRAEGVQFVQRDLLDGDPSRGSLWIGTDTMHFKQLWRNELVRIVWVALSGLVLALGLGFFLGHRIGMPLSLVSHATLKLADGELDARVEAPPHSVKEVEQLVDSFNVMASELEQSRERLLHAERVATWQEIARGLAHELKNPLTPILGALKVVRRAKDKNHPDFDLILQEQSFAVEEEVMRLKNMADSFAKFARLPEPQPEPMCLLELLDTVLSLYAGADTIEVRRDFPEEAPMVADAERLRTLFTNLIKNASDAMRGQGKLRVAVNVAFVGSISGYAIRVEDTGPGIAPEVSDKLFMPYVTTKADGGTGLGLALGLRIVTEMGGQIRVDEAYEEGAAFEVWLPAASREA